MRPYQYVVDCINMSTIVYLFYCQGMVKLREARKALPDLAEMRGEYENVVFNEFIHL